MRLIAIDEEIVASNHHRINSAAVLNLQYLISINRRIEMRHELHLSLSNISFIFKKIIKFNSNVILFHAVSITFVADPRVFCYKKKKKKLYLTDLISHKYYITIDVYERAFDNTCRDINPVYVETRKLFMR